MLFIMKNGQHEQSVSSLPLHTPPAPVILKQIPYIISSIDISVCIFNISGYFSKHNHNTIIITLKMGSNFLILSNSSVEISLVNSQCSLVYPKVPTLRLIEVS